MSIYSNNTLSNVYSSYENSVGKTESEKTSSAKKSNYGKTFGDAKLSAEAEKYYKELKQKFGNLDFVLVSKDQKENAKAHASSFANPAKMVVLIDEEKIEKMASDPQYRKQMEQTIASGSSNMKNLKSGLETTGQADNLLGFGMKVNDDGSTSFFAVLKKSAADQKARIEKKLEERRETRRADSKKEAKERLERIKSGDSEDENYDGESITFSASTVEELLQKIKDYDMTVKTDNVRTESEKAIGQSIDYKG